MAVPRVLCRLRLLVKSEFSLVSKPNFHIHGAVVNQCVLVQRRFRTNFSTHLPVLSKESQDQLRSSSSSSSSSSDSDSDEEDVTVEYHKGLPQITVPLPSRKERCRFTLKPISNTVGDFLEMLKREDKGIDRVVCKAFDGTRIASSNTIETLLDDNFRLIINDNSYNVNTPKQERLTSEEVQRLSDVKTMVNQLYESLHVQEHQLQKERELSTQLETLQQELQPLEDKRNEIEMAAMRRSNFMAWVGLGLMSVQFGILARLTWWEYSWDIMEPVTYFVTYGTAMAAYAYYVLTKEEYILADVRDRQYLLVVHQKAKKLGLDLNQYNTLKEQLNRLDHDLRKLRNPLRLQLPQRAAAAASSAGAVDASGGADLATISNILSTTEKDATDAQQQDKSDTKDAKLKDNSETTTKAG